MPGAEPFMGIFYDPEKRQVNPLVPVAFAIAAIVAIALIFVFGNIKLQEKKKNPEQVQTTDIFQKF